MKKALVFAAFVIVFAAASASAFDTTPLQLAIWPSRLQVVPEYIDVSGIKLNLPFGRNENIVGLDAGIASSSSKTSALQVNLLNRVHDRYAGFQVGILNQTGNSSGVQIGVLMNATDSVAKGIQIGIINTSLEMSGLQVGFINYTEFMTGFQVGLINIIRESIIPFFPIVNFCF
ncbi:MAG TPA: hypothetical protein PKY10_06445 [Lentisphaeria bacterium]|nr:hypothetical protein [Lentisphaeria bacterium]